MENISPDTVCSPRHGYRKCQSVYSVTQFCERKGRSELEDIQYAGENHMQEEVQLKNCNLLGGPIANDIRSKFTNYFISIMLGDLATRSA